MSSQKGRRLDAGRRQCATFDPSPSRPGCEDPHVGPHNRCAHPTFPPRGFRRCAGDGACPMLLRDRYPSRFCPWHADQIWALPEQQRNAELAAIDAMMRHRPNHRTGG